MQGIQIDREFLNLTIPFTEDKKEHLDRSLLRHGCLEPISVWRGVILDGHKRYKFCTYEEIAFEVREMDFKSREHAVIWVCTERLAHIENNHTMYRYLLGKWYRALKRTNESMRQGDKTHQQPEYENRRTDQVLNASEQIMAITGHARSTIQRDAVFADALDRIADIDPILFEAILREDIKLNKTEIREISKQDKRALSELRRRKLGNKDIKMRQRRNVKIQASEAVSGKDMMEEEIPIKTGIKEMPVYDPDMEIKGLALTIPTWINVIAKAERKMDLFHATDKAKSQLITNLVRLQEQVTHILEVLR